MPTPDYKYWRDFLNARAKELSLAGTVRMVQPRDGEMVAVDWVYDNDGELIDLGWNVEEAEAQLRRIAGEM